MKKIRENEDIRLKKLRENKGRKERKREEGVRE